MKKAAIFLLTLCLMVTFFTVTPASARPDHFWPGVAIGVGSAIILGQLFHPTKGYDNDYRPVRVYTHPTHYSPPPPPASREQRVPRHWVQNYDQNGNGQRHWVPKHRGRIDY